MEHAYRRAVALADAELSAAEVPALVQELARNPSLLRALQVYVAVGRRRIAKPYEAKREEPVPQWLIETVMRAPIESAARRRTSKLGALGSGFVQRLTDRYALPGWTLAGPVVASLLAAVSAWLLLPGTSHGETLLAAQLQRTIETAGSRQEAPLLGFRPVMTFLSKDHGYCRQYDVRSATERSAGVACRTQAGAWQVVMQLPPYPTFAPADSGREAVNAYVEAMRVGPPLEPDKVDQLIHSEWRLKP